MTHLNRIEKKIIRAEDSVQINAWLYGQKNKLTVFTNGCFDLVHTGHIDYLSKAADLGQSLVVALNSDSSVRVLKGPSRPIKDEWNRALVLAAFQFIDLVIIFSDSTPKDLITQIKPDILVKGGDYDPNETNLKAKTYIVGSDVVRSNGGNVCVIPFVKGHSSTKLINKF